jgi:hypothetical protein
MRNSNAKEQGDYLEPSIPRGPHRSFYTQLRAYSLPMGIWYLKCGDPKSSPERDAYVCWKPRKLGHPVSPNLVAGSNFYHFSCSKSKLRRGSGAGRVGIFVGAATQIILPTSRDSTSRQASNSTNMTCNKTHTVLMPTPVAGTECSLQKESSVVQQERGRTGAFSVEQDSAACHRSCVRTSGGALYSKSHEARQWAALSLNAVRH